MSILQGFFIRHCAFLRIEPCTISCPRTFDILASSASIVNANTKRFYKSLRTSGFVRLHYTSVRLLTYKTFILSK
ncbi:hypothetical protein EDO6_02958 [Paenibacillus xylanexedens]|nr:hypothetical protein EDO6_02958 [Paenibacillus xylanexedens]